ncbi:MAG: hypothetical protein ACKPKO_21535, partial [Candidatus Fonsibacter sp.]
RLASVSPHFKWKVLNAAQRKQWWVENRSEDGPSAPCPIDVLSKLNADIDIWSNLDEQVEMYNDPSKIFGECYMREVDVGAPALPVKTCVSQSQSWVMPIRVEKPRQHREKLSELYTFTYPALVARPVGRAEIAAKPAAAEEINHQWNRLRNKFVFGRG